MNDSLLFGKERRQLSWTQPIAPLLFIIKDPLVSQPLFRSVNNLCLSKSNCRPMARSSGPQFAERALRFHPLPHLEDVFTTYTAIKMGHLFSSHGKKKEMKKRKKKKP